MDNLPLLASGDSGSEYSGELETIQSLRVRARAPLPYPGLLSGVTVHFTELYDDSDHAQRTLGRLARACLRAHVFSHLATSDVGLLQAYSEPPPPELQKLTTDQTRALTRGPNAEIQTLVRHYREAL